MRIHSCLFGAALAAGLAWASTAAAADPDPADWSSVVEAAKGQTVYFNAWGGSENINAYLEWAGERLEEDYGVTVVHVKLDDTANAVAKVLAEKTAGKNESGTPLWSVGARGQIALGPVELGAQVKHTGKRWVNDINDLSVDGYTLVDLDVRVRLGEYFNGKDAALQFNVTNLFDEFYVGGFGGDLDGVGFAQMGPPRAATVSLILGY